MREITVAVTQMACGDVEEQNLEKAEELVRSAAAQGAQIILLQELFAGKYFCQEQKSCFFSWAKPADESNVIARMQALAQELCVVLPISFFERCNQAHYNSVVMIDADGKRLGTYRKSHIPDGPGYQEKFYFNPGDSGFKVWQTMYGRVGAGICWDQWFPECARAMALMGAEILLYPTAIGSEPQDPSLNSKDHWKRVMQGHAAANLMPVIASNRIGREEYPGSTITFYGNSFIADQTGALVKCCGDEEAVLSHTFDLDQIQEQRSSWGLFRDRRPELYKPLLTLDGRE
ncbi:unnamed protein product [Chrysoparadoxa australica]